MAQPTYQLIKAQLSARFDQQYKGKTRDCIPVFTQPSDISEWAKAPGWAKMAGEGKDAEDLTIGRQMGEKVELFEVPHMDVRMLRKGMEDQELKVSLYKPEETTIITRGTSTLINKCHEYFAAVVHAEETKSGRKIEHGLIADFPGPKKSLVLIRVDAGIVDDVKTQGLETITIANQFTYDAATCKILGHVSNSKPVFECDEATTKSYFNSLGRMGKEQGVVLHDAVESRERAAKEEYKKAKKAAKKERRAAAKQ